MSEELARSVSYVPPRDQSIEFCACKVYAPGEECGMAVCWICEQPVGRTDEFGAATIRALQGAVRSDTA